MVTVSALCAWPPRFRNPSLPRWHKPKSALSSSRCHDPRVTLSARDELPMPFSCSRDAFPSARRRRPVRIPENVSIEGFSPTSSALDAAGLALVPPRLKALRLRRFCHLDRRRSLPWMCGCLCQHPRRVTEVDGKTRCHATSSNDQASPASRGEERAAEERP